MVDGKRLTDPIWEGSHERQRVKEDRAASSPVTVLKQRELNNLLNVPQGLELEQPLKDLGLVFPFSLSLSSSPSPPLILSYLDWV